MDDHLPGLSGMKRSKIAQTRAKPRHATEIHLQPTKAPTISTYRTPIVTKTYNEFHGFTVCARNCGLHEKRSRSAIFFSSFALSEPHKLIFHQIIKGRAHLPVHVFHFVGTHFLPCEDHDIWHTH